MGGGEIRDWWEGSRNTFQALGEVAIATEYNTNTEAEKPTCFLCEIHPDMWYSEIWNRPFLSSLTILPKQSRVSTGLSVKQDFPDNPRVITLTCFFTLFFMEMFFSWIYFKTLYLFFFFTYVCLCSFSDTDIPLSSPGKKKKKALQSIWKMLQINFLLVHHLFFGARLKIHLSAAPIWEFSSLVMSISEQLNLQEY